MSTFVLKGMQSDFTPVSNVFIEKYMPLARGEFVKVYLLMLKYNTCGEAGVTSEVMASTLNLLESDVLNALSHWNDEGVLKLTPLDKMGNFDIEFEVLSKENRIDEKQVDLLKELGRNSSKDMLGDIQKLLGRPLSPKEMEVYLSWQDDFGFSSELILLLVEYCVSKGKSDYRYIERVSIAWKDSGISTLEEAQNNIKNDEEQWKKIRHVLKYLGINNTEVMKPQKDLILKWIKDYAFPMDVIERACSICFNKLNKTEFKYIDGILSKWHKSGFKTLEDVQANDKKSFYSPAVPYGKGNYTSNNSKRHSGQNSIGRSAEEYEEMEKELLGWY